MINGFGVISNALELGWPTIIVIVALLGSPLLMAVNFRMGLLLNMFIFGLIAMWMYYLQPTILAYYLPATLISVLFMIIFALTILSKEQPGGAI